MENTEKPIIEIRKISKRYEINHMKGGYISLRDVITNVFRNPFSFLKTKTRQIIGLEKKEEFWALKDISFSINKGDIVGVIGSNGAGKSTLLKILTGITPPSDGEAILRGRVGSLLEVGTGFHPELSGRENIFLNGAILGMKKKEIAKKFDAIVSFAGIEKFLDTPVKHYSSGMYVRLAFSVAAHMETEILLIDEVLAVGDSEFQKKCLGKMDEITKGEGRTILFVSHNLTAIQQLCKKTIVLDKGKVIFQDTTEKAIEYYSNIQNNRTITNLEDNTNRRGNGSVKLTGFHTENHNNEISYGIKNNSIATIAVSYECSDPAQIKNIEMGFSLERNGSLVSILYNTHTKSEITKIESKGFIKFTTPKLILAPGIYNVGVRILANGIESDWPRGSVGSFEVLPSDEYIKNGYTSDSGSIVLMEGTWS